MTLYLAVLIGAIIYGFIDYLGTTGNNVFSKKYLGTTIVNILCGASLIWALGLKESQFMLSEFDFTRVVAMSFGVTGQKLWKGLIKLADKSVRTKFGINKKK